VCVCDVWCRPLQETEDNGESELDEEDEEEVDEEDEEDDGEGEKRESVPV